MPRFGGSRYSLQIFPDTGGVAVSGDLLTYVTVRIYSSGDNGTMKSNRLLSGQPEKEGTLNLGEIFGSAAAAIIILMFAAGGALAHYEAKEKRGPMMPA